MRNNSYMEYVFHPLTFYTYTTCTTLCRVTKEDEGKGEKGEGKEKKKEKKKEERTYVRTLRIFTANSSSHFRFFFFSSHPSFFSPSFFPLLRVNRRKVIVQPFEARRDSPGPFFSFSAPPPLPPLPDDIKWRCSRRWSILVPNSQLASSNDDKS